MKLSVTPPTVLEHEQNILYSISEIRKMLASQPINDVCPRRVIESEGYAGSDVANIQEILCPDGVTRLVARVLIPVDRAWMGAAAPIWTFAGKVALGLDSNLGMNGMIVPGSSFRVRYNPGLSNGATQHMDITAVNPVWDSAVWGSDVDKAYLVTNGPMKGIWAKQIAPYNTCQFSYPGNWTWQIKTQSELDAAIAQPGTILL